MKNKKPAKIHVIVGIDPGETSSGLSCIMLNTECPEKTELIGLNVENSLVVSKIREYYVKYNPIVVIEDVVPYKNRVSKNLIATCKFIGELNYRLKFELFLEIHHITRGKVKKWLFEQQTGLCVERIDKKIAYLDGYKTRKGEKGYKNKDGVLRKATFHFVDDRIVIEAMKRLWNIPTPKPGKKNIYGFSSHSWQALAVASYFLAETP